MNEAELARNSQLVRRACCACFAVCIGGAAAGEADKPNILLLLLPSFQTEYAVKDLNEDPKLPYEDNSFDVITNAGAGGGRGALDAAWLALAACVLRPCRPTAALACTHAALLLPPMLSRPRLN